MTEEPGMVAILLQQERAGLEMRILFSETSCAFAEKCNFKISFFMRICN